MIPKINGISHTMNGTKNSTPQVTSATRKLATYAIAHVMWKFNAITECARTTGDVLPLARYEISGPIQPRNPPPRNTPATPPQWAIRT
jgi:hypothetical protein